MERGESGRRKRRGRPAILDAASGGGGGGGRPSGAQRVVAERLTRDQRGGASSGSILGVRK